MVFVLFSAVHVLFATFGASISLINVLVGFPSPSDLFAASFVSLIGKLGGFIFFQSIQMF